MNNQKKKFKQKINNFFALFFKSLLIVLNNYRFKDLFKKSFAFIW
jgi:hypothetical protein